MFICIWILYMIVDKVILKIFFAIWYIMIIYSQKPFLFSSVTLYNILDIEILNVK